MSYGNPSVVQKFRVSKNFMLQRFMSQSSLELFCLTVSNSFVREPYSAVFQKKSGREKVYGKQGGRVPRFSVENFLSHSAKKFVVESFSVSLCSGIEKVRDRRRLQNPRFSLELSSFQSA